MASNPKHQSWLRRRHCRFERLDERLLLDAAGVELAPDRFTFYQNGESQDLDLLANDEFGADYQGRQEITAVSFGSQGGRLRIADDRKSVLYRPPADFAGQESFAYFVDTQFSSTVTIDVVGLVADDAYQLVADGQPRQLELLQNDPFPADYLGARKITIVSETRLGGQLAVASDGQSVVYTMPEGVYGKDSFVYIVDDRYPARVTVDIPNPLESDRGELVQNDGPTVFAVLANDPLWPGYAGERQITHVFATAEGAEVEIAADGETLTYKPPADFHGYDVVKYVVDSRFESQLQLTVHRPTRDDYATVDAGSSNFFIELTGNDRYRTLSGGHRDIVDRITAVGESQQGAAISIAANGQGVLYTPAANFSGSDEFTYVADDKYPATVRVSVTDPVRDDYLEVFHDTVNNELDVLQNDFLGNGYSGARQITSVGDTVAGGTVAISADGKSLLYTPPELFGSLGSSDRVEYEVDDRFVATVHLRVSPIVVSDYYRFSRPQERRLDVLENDHFSANYLGAGLITEVSEPSDGGSVTIIDGGRALWYSPGNSSADFTYTVDGKHSATVSVAYPNRLAPDEETVDQNSGAAEFDVLANDFQSVWIQNRWGVYTGPRVITSVGETDSGGAVEVSADGKHIHYTPAPDFHGNDRFSYIVDGFLETQVTVHVIRRVRDDQFHVDPGSTANSLPVLINDLFAADYTGAGRVTGVTATAAEGSISVAADGRTVSYTPPDDFTGQDKFTYTVDGGLKAEVTVFVHSSLDARFNKFGELQSFRQFLIDDALTRYEPLFGQQGYPYDFGDGQFEAAPGVGGGRLHSETNVQVAGVDEADLIETDGSYLYTVTGDELVISRAWPADQLEVISKTAISGTPIGQYLHGDRLAVVSRVWSYGDGHPLPELDAAFAPGDSLILPPFPPSTSSTIVTIFDVSDRQAPQVVQQTELDGNYVESRRLGDHVFLVLNGGTASLPRPELNCEEDQCIYETREEYLARVLSNFESLLEETLPKYSSLGPDGSLVRSGSIVQPEDIFEPLAPGRHNLLSVVTVNMANSAPGLAATSGILTAGATNIYGSLENLYVFQDQQRWSSEEGSTVEVLKFTWNGDTGSVDPVATGSVPGRMVDQFSADEHAGHLRIATTVSNSYSGNFSGRSENLLFVLDDDRGVLEFSGGLKNLALDESIRSVRFFGERAFVVTFQNVDPLFGIDLSDPTEPRPLGHLTLPGFSEYLQFIEEDRLLTVGRNTPDGFSGPAMVSLFNVAELAEPVLIDRFTLPRYSESEANIDHHAFGWYAPSHVLAVPAARSYPVRVDKDEDGYRETTEYVSEHELYTFQIDTAPSARSDVGIELLGTIEHDAPVRRSAFIEDKVYSIADTSIKAANINDPASIISEVVTAEGLASPPLPTPGTPVWDKLDRFQGRARAELAGRLGTDLGSIMAVTSEADTTTQNRFKTVLRAANRYFVYASEGDEVVMAGDEYSFPPAGTLLQWHNQDNAYDVDGDGVVAPRDVGIIINDLNRSGSRVLPSSSVVRQIDHSQYYLDVTADSRLSAIDALRVINFLSRRAAREGEGGPVLSHLTQREGAVAAATSQAAELIDLVLRDDQRPSGVSPGVSTDFAASHTLHLADEDDTSLDAYLASLDRVPWEELSDR